MGDLHVDRDGVTLVGSYSPAGTTAVVCLHGAGEGARDYFLYERLHALLPPAGIGVVTFDRRGEGASSGDSSRGRFEIQADDALAFADAVDAEQVGLWGISQGGWTAPLAAARSERVSFLVLVSSAGVTPSEQMMFAVAEQLRLAGWGETVVERALDLRRRFEAWIHGDRQDEQALARDLDAGADEPWWSLAFLPPELLDADSRRLWIEEMDFDPRPIFARTTVPTILFYGAADGWIPVDESVRAWREARGDTVEIAVVPEASHELTLPDGTIAPVYERRLVEWLVERGAASG